MPCLGLINACRCDAHSLQAEFYVDRVSTVSPSAGEMKYTWASSGAGVRANAILVAKHADISISDKDFIDMNYLRFLLQLTDFFTASSTFIQMGCATHGVYSIQQTTSN